jgi:hypothetical protein
LDRAAAAAPARSYVARQAADPGQRLRDLGRIAELVLYCTGDWDPQTRARHAAQSPMIRG